MVVFTNLPWKSSELARTSASAKTNSCREVWDFRFRSTSRMIQLPLFQDLYSHLMTSQPDLVSEVECCYHGQTFLQNGKKFNRWFMHIFLLEANLTLYNILFEIFERFEKRSGRGCTIVLRWIGTRLPTSWTALFTLTSNWIHGMRLRGHICWIYQCGR